MLRPASSRALLQRIGPALPAQVRSTEIGGLHVRRAHTPRAGPRGYPVAAMPDPVSVSSVANPMGITAVANPMPVAAVPRAIAIVPVAIVPVAITHIGLFI